MTRARRSGKRAPFALAALLLAAVALAALTARPARALFDAYEAADVTDSFALLSTFGMAASGVVRLSPRTVTLSDQTAELELVAERSDVDSFLSSPHACDWNAGSSNVFFFGTLKNGDKEDIEFTVDAAQDRTPGLYRFFLRNCNSNRFSVSIDVEAYNVFDGQRDYLSLGDSPLPVVFFVFTGLFAVLLVLWVIVLRRHWNQRRIVHIFMTMVIVANVLTQLFDGAHQLNLSRTGHIYGWSVVFYIVSIIKGVLFFFIILLIGSGFSLIKPVLSSREKKIVFIVVPLQVIVNILRAVVDTMKRGSSGWLAWTDVLYLIDIVCCIIVMLPIVWSVQHLKRLADADTRASRNLKRLAMFRNFYFLVMTYIYVTRIFVALIQAVVPYHLTYLGSVFQQLVGLAFYVIVGYTFRPGSENPYLAVDTDDHDDPMDGTRTEADEMADLRARMAADTSAFEMTAIGFDDDDVPVRGTTGAAASAAASAAAPGKPPRAHMD